MRAAVAASSVCILVAAAASGWWLASAVAARPEAEEIRSAIVPLKDTPENKGDWGVMRPYFTGQTGGTSGVFVAAGTIQPGKSVHGAHRHAEEEYLLITEGSGTWSLEGKETPARKGDMLYVQPWVFHGIKNTGKSPLEFAVFKYTAKGVPVTSRPDSGKDELDH